MKIHRRAVLTADGHFDPVDHSGKPNGMTIAFPSGTHFIVIRDRHRWKENPADKEYDGDCHSVQISGAHYKVPSDWLEAHRIED